MNKIFFFRTVFIVMLLAIAFDGAASDSDGNTYPTPERLFYITRSANKNLVCYDANLTNGTLDAKHPLHVYWVNREEHPGKTQELNYFQRKMAYGYKLISSKDDSSVVTLTAYSGKQLTIKKQGSKYICTTTINNRPALLLSLYVKANPKNPLSVEYVELRGTDLETQKPLTERVSK